MGPEEYVLCGESVSEILGALTEHQQVVVLLMAAGYTQEEVGARFGASHQAVSDCIRRIRARLHIAPC